jgi:AcrR family transcriptional regulator
MARPVKRSREYRSVVRAEQAQRTRERIVEAARRRFLEDGYAGTSVASIAEEAVVAPETVYDVFGTKRRVLEAVIEVRVAGRSDEPADYLERKWVRETIALGELPLQLREFVRHTVGTLSRAGPIDAVLRNAAGSDAELGELLQQQRDYRFAAQRRIMGAIAAGHPGFDADEAAATFSALASPELHHLLIVSRGWSPNSYADWLEKTVIAALIDG